MDNFENKLTEYKICTACQRPYKYDGMMITEWVLTDPDQVKRGRGAGFCDECNNEFNQLINAWLRYRTEKNEDTMKKS